MVQRDEAVIDQAIAWHIRLADGTEADWAEFTDWLEADPGNNAAYEAIADADLMLQPTIDIARASSKLGAVRTIEEGGADVGRSSRRRWLWPAMAASIALVGAGVEVTLRGIEQEYTVSTAPGERRTLSLADGSRIVLNGDTKIVLNRREPRMADLKSGEAQFSVVHDAERPFSVSIDDQRIVDLGTVFNVRSNGQRLQVEVAQGSVRYEEGVTHLRLNAGDTLMADGTQIIEGSKPASDIGSWTRGRLIYHASPVIDVAADLTRAKGIAIELGPELSQQTFTGVIDLDGSRAELRRRLELLLQAKVTETADGWSITH